MKLSDKENNFINFSMHIWNLHQISNIFGRKMTLIGYVFSKLEAASDMVS